MNYVFIYYLLYSIFNKRYFQSYIFTIVENCEVGTINTGKK